MQEDGDTFPLLLEEYRKRLRRLDELMGQALVTTDEKVIQETLLCMDELSVYWSAVRRRLVMRWRELHV